ncbi:hypothetical protein CDD83_11020 [Cordyceps sp. RAO-2017]|nr:hypothetical protein CDD83_11020 [Cordyceps sp. RAO-2017]
MSDPSSPAATPKRKRGQELPVTPIKFSFDPATVQSPEDGSQSPQSSVAHRFRGLALGGADDAETADVVRKRRRPDDYVLAARPESPSSRGPPRPVPPLAAIGSVEAAADGGPRARRRRSGTPPLRLKASPAAQGGEPMVDQDEVPLADPVRAALTWHEDEITVYDPDDDDDDGTGINGVGFKPTPALAHARAAKRRQQMAEYRRREENEARARRSQRRRGDAAAAPPSGGVTKKKSPTRKVRFKDAESQKIAVTTV